MRGVISGLVLVLHLFSFSKLRTRENRGLELLELKMLPFDALQ